MSDLDEARRAVAVEWLGKAHNDLVTAEHTLKLGEVCPTDTVCFHAQQCVEKCIKAYLVAKNIEFPRTHDIDLLAHKLPQGTSLPLTSEDQSRLTEYATVMRYPGGYEAVPLDEARRAVELARRVQRVVTKWLPSRSETTQNRSQKTST